MEKVLCRVKKLVRDLKFSVKYLPRTHARTHAYASVGSKDAFQTYIKAYMGPFGNHIKLRMLSNLSFYHWSCDKNRKENK